MYSLVLMSALTATPDGSGWLRDLFDRGNCYGCSGAARYSCYGGCCGADYYASCNGCCGGIFSGFGKSPGGNAGPETVDALECGNALLEWPAMGQASREEVKEAYPRLVKRVQGLDAAGRQKWLDLAHAVPDREAPTNLLKELSK